MFLVFQHLLGSQRMRARSGPWLSSAGGRVLRHMFCGSCVFATVNRKTNGMLREFIHGSTHLTRAFDDASCFLAYGMQMGATVLQRVC